MTLEQPQTVYVAIWEDRHSEPSVHVFVDSDDAIEWSKCKIRDLNPDDLDEELTLSMQAAGWLYYGCYSCEGDCIRVVPSLLRRSAESTLNE